MPKSRPQLSITLPRNFTFHYKDGEEPKTPEQDVAVTPPRSPRAEGPYRIKRRSRPAAASLLPSYIEARTLVGDEAPLTSIETPPIVRPSRPLFHQIMTEPSNSFLAAGNFRRFATLPRTPEPQTRSVKNRWTSQQNLGDSIVRPLSVCSISSDSSDVSDGSLASYPAGDGSCTSPESDASDPFKFSSIRRSRGKHWAAITESHQANIPCCPGKKSHLKWTPEMDRHLWSTYLVYLQDPTVTPFKMLPGVAPPLGVCHRVSREARKSWRPGSFLSRRSSGMLSPLSMWKGATGKKKASGSPDTIRGHNNPSSDDTPTGVPPRSGLWPKSGSSTRRRLRLLCKRKPTIAPHYQRLLQSRSPSPFSSGVSSLSRSPSRVLNAKSPLGSSSSPFSTRDVQLSLTTSTADTMQSDGPLAQLMATNPSLDQLQSEEWFNEPPMPFASEIPIPSDVEFHRSLDDSIEAPRLGSPFGFHTWGPSRSKQRLRPNTPRMQPSDAAHTASILRSPLHIHDTFPYPGIHKRRARHQLEDELSPGGSNVKEGFLTDLFTRPGEQRHRRVRSRGFSLGDVNGQNALESLFTPPECSDHAMDSESTSALTGSISLEPKTPTKPVHLESPFQGVSPRSGRRTPRHMISMSLGSNKTQVFPSIGEKLVHAACSGGRDAPDSQDR